MIIEQFLKMDKKTFLFYLLMGYTLPGFSLMDINYGFEEDPQEAIGKKLLKFLLRKPEEYVNLK